MPWQTDTLQEDDKTEDRTEKNTELILNASPQIMNLDIRLQRFQPRLRGTAQGNGTGPNTWEYIQEFLVLYFHALQDE